MDFRYDSTFAQQLVEVADETNRVNCELTVEKALEQIKSDCILEAKLGRYSFILSRDKYIRIYDTSYPKLMFKTLCDKLGKLGLSVNEIKRESFSPVEYIVNFKNITGEDGSDEKH
jgi:hypothetical protein